MKSKQIKIMRKQLEKANRIDKITVESIIANAIASRDTTSLPCHYYVTYQTASEWSSDNGVGDSSSNLLQQCYALFEENMGEMYRQSSWGLNREEKLEELRHRHARYLLVRLQQLAESNNDCVKGKTDLIAFCHFRFCYDDDEDPTSVVLYVYEIQVSTAAARQGLGTMLMRVIESIAQQVQLNKVMLTVFKSNNNAMSFYTKRLGYKLDKCSPSQFGEVHEDYEILSKIV